jgi:hypothetical protein
VIIDSFRGEYWFLSMFSPVLIIGANNLAYRSGEAAFHGGKTSDPQIRAWIAAAPTPLEAKRRGRSRKVALRSDWDSHRHVVMRAVLRQKFSRPELAELLVKTGDAELIEGNTWHDNDWGDCRCGRPACERPGENFLGRYLMELRSELRQ